MWGKMDDRISAQVVNCKMVISDSEGVILTELEPGGKPKNFFLNGRDYWARWDGIHSGHVTISSAEEGSLVGFGQIKLGGNK